MSSYPQATAGYNSANATRAQKTQRLINQAANATQLQDTAREVVARIHKAQAMSADDRLALVTLILAGVAPNTLAGYIPSQS